MITTITAYDSRGKIVFRSSEPRDMSNKDIAQCLRDWVIDTKKNNISCCRSFAFFC